MLDVWIFLEKKKKIGVDDIKVRKHKEDRDPIVHTHPISFLPPSCACLSLGF